MRDMLAMLERMLRERKHPIILRLEDNGRITVEEVLEPVATHDDAEYSGGSTLEFAIYNFAVVTDMIKMED